jgi:uncharacterized protein
MVDGRVSRLDVLVSSRSMMNKQDVLDTLRRNEEALRARGIVHAALFGSVARGEADAASDVDIMIELDPDLELDIYAYAGLKTYVAGLFNGATPADHVGQWITWANIAGAGKIYRHECADVLEQQIWNTVHNGLAPLRLVVESELRRTD